MLQTGCRSLAPSTVHSPQRIFSSRHTRHTLICVRPGGPHTAVRAPPVLAVQRSVWISQTPCRITPLGSTLGIGFSFVLTEGEPLDHAVPRIFDQIFAILGAEERREGRPQARLGFIEQHVREVCWATVPHLEAFGMRELMRQTGKRGQSHIRVNSVPRPGVCAKEHRVLHFIETGP